MLTHDDYIRLQLNDTDAMLATSPPPILELPGRGDMAGVVLRVIDGDSLEACALVRIGSIRVLGIDAPELATPAGKRSKQFAESILPVGRVLLMRLQGPDKFGARVLGDVQLPEGEWFSQAMLNAKYARPYDGGKRD